MAISAVSTICFSAFANARGYTTFGPITLATMLVPQSCSPGMHMHTVVVRLAIFVSSVSAAAELPITEAV